jgi:predicted dehydrogenase
MGRRIGIGLIGYSFMGRAHSSAWRNVAAVFDTELVPALAVISGRHEGPLKDAAARLGWTDWTTDWRALVARDDVDVVDVSTPGNMHAEMAIAALEAGKHVLCEKPLANSVAEAEAMAEAARRVAPSGVKAMVGFNYRRLPALALASQLVVGGTIGRIRHVRAVYLQDWLIDPAFPLTWRLQRGLSGSGALGDLGAHIIDLARFVTGEEISEVSALLETFVKHRPEVGEADGLPATTGEGQGSVTVDDAAVFLGRLSGGGMATFEATRFATGRKNGLRFELNGERGSLGFDLERPNELELYESRDGRDAGFRRVLVTEGDHPYVSGWWPPGHVLGWDHSFVNEARDFLVAVETDGALSPDFEDGLAVQRVLAAVETSASERCWVNVEPSGRYR